MEQLIFLLIKLIFKALVPEAGRKTPTPARPNVVTQAPPPRSTSAPSTAADAWDDFRRKQAAMERELARKSPTASDRRQ